MSYIARAGFFVIALGSLSAASLAVTFGQQDNFQDGTVQNWLVNLLGQGGGAPPPVNEAGGPGGASDRFMRLTSTGTAGAGGRLVVINATQWTGNYVDAGVTMIRMDLRNFGPTDLNLRLLFEKAVGGPPTDIATSTNSVLVPAGSGWVTRWFPIAASDLTALTGTIGNAITQTTHLRLFHNPSASIPPPPIEASLGVDNITAVPEPGTLAAVGAGLALLIRRRKTVEKS